MKKILFIIHFGNINKSSGIISKIINQSIAMHNLGIHYKTYILYKESEKNDVANFKYPEYVEFIPLEFYKKEKSLIKNYIIIQKIYFEYIKICEKNKNSYDYIYVRMNPIYYGFLKFIYKYKGKLIFEHNSMEKDEYRANKAFYKVLKCNIFDKMIRKNAFGYVCVTKEIYDYQKKLYKNNKGIIITNGIDVDSYKKKKSIKFDGKNLNMIFVGNIRYWHGLERILIPLSKYDKDIKITFNICGLVNQDDDYITPLVNNANKNKNVKVNMLGYKNKDELDKYFDEAHIAIGTLGCYKKNITHASVLKNREYFSRGIPIIFSEIDDDICVKENTGLYLKVTNDSSEINIDNIVDFVKNFSKNNTENIKKIKNFAKKELDYNGKMIKLEELINGKNK